MDQLIPVTPPVNGAFGDGSTFTLIVFGVPAIRIRSLSSKSVKYVGPGEKPGVKRLKAKPANRVRLF